MKKKLLSFVLSLFFIISCGIMLSSCGDNPPDDSHTHNWSSTWSKDATNHWKTCDGCDEKKDKANHDGDTCTICGYVKSSGGQSSGQGGSQGSGQGSGQGGSSTPDDNLPVVSSVRDLEIVTMATVDGGYVTLVKLPDGKNMLLGAGADSFGSELSMDELLININGITTIDYFVLTSTPDMRIGGADSIFDYYEVKEFYYPTFGASVTTSSSYNLSLDKSQSENGCISKNINETNCDIDYSFKDSTGTSYNYKVDFMFPVDFSTSTNLYDATIVVSIQYKDKTILIAGDATMNNIDGYCSKYGTTKNVDALITFFLPGECNAIAGSANRGTDYLNKIGLDANNLCLVGINNGTADVGNLYSKIGYLGDNVKTLSYEQSTTNYITIAITDQGVDFNN